MMKKKVIKKEDFITTKWAGGETTQFTIYPENANFADKDFIFRISSATFTSTESRFSDFSGYQRYILPLEGSIELYHQGLYKRQLDRYHVEYFDGSWDTFSKNTIDCRDYNFIYKNGYLAKMQLLNSGDDYSLKAPKIITVFSMEDYILDIGKGKKWDMDGFSLLILQIEDQLKLKILGSSAPVIVTDLEVDSK